ncbi:PKS-ER domain-containing protein [Fusarium keratoplasticum]|uniref:PKS-ER domain-containing protein n=1 Tax=Fusarium keratoplasticum TaxID=1328300 RepID=A0ACC0QGR3_9HYPO|nr:PKS-ER domain-containing protein [Fusarium keratoplasticum]KAI8654709.1 PKS-ER domain-containing protein [Fusarium keratoplasticum]
MDPMVKAQAEEAIFALGESVGRASAASPELNVAIIWPMTLKDGFLDLIRARHPAALVVVAHYCTPNLVSANMQAWQYTTIKDTLESSLTLNEKATPPDAQSLPRGHVLVQVITAAVNPVEYKLPEAPLYGKFMLQPPASPGLDFCGRIKAINDTDDSLKEGQLVFGALSITSKFPKFGTLSQVIVAPVSQLTVLPAGVAPDDAATVGTAGMTAYQSLPQDLIGPGTNIFINGGSGGVGSFTVQFAKALGATVTTTCSTANVKLCRDLGADEVIDYRKLNVISELKKKGQIFDLAIDNVGTPAGMYEQSQHFLKPDGTFVQVAMQQSLPGMLRRSLLPSFLGGGKRQYRLVRVNINRKDLQQAGQWMAEGKVRAVIDHKLEWKEAPKAYEKLRLGRTVGKIVVHVGHA